MTQINGQSEKTAALVHDEINMSATASKSKI